MGDNKSHKHSSYNFFLIGKMNMINYSTLSFRTDITLVMKVTHIYPNVIQMTNIYLFSSKKEGKCVWPYRRHLSCHI